MTWIAVSIVAAALLCSIVNWANASLAFRGKIIMSQAIDRLTASIIAANASTDALAARIAALPQPVNDDSAVNAAADQVDALKVKLDGILPAAQ